MTDAAYPELNIAVCDDEEADRKRVSALSAELLYADGIAFRIFEYEGAASLLRDMETGREFQLLLLDVMMEGTDGMDLAAALRRQGNRTAIVFISSNRECAMRGYEVSAARYLAKPIDREKLREALQYCCQECLVNREILLQTPEGRSRITLSELMYAEARDHSVRLSMTERETNVSMTISELQRLLPASQFLLIHRAFLANLAYVKSLGHWSLTLNDGRTLPVSKYRYAEVKRIWANYLSG